MKMLLVLTSFQYAVEGIHVRTFKASDEPQEVPDEVYDWAIEKEKGEDPDEPEDNWDLEDMTIAELRSFAEPLKDCDLSKLTKKADIIEAIRKAIADDDENGNGEGGNSNPENNGG